MKKVGILTGGGDCPGINAVIRAAVIRLASNDIESLGFIEGWHGLIEDETMPLRVSDVLEILPYGGTVLGTSRTNPYKKPEENVPQVLDNIRKNKIDALICIGGDDTLGVANRLYNEEGVHLVGIPKTIDNDLSATDLTFGFNTAINIVMEAVDRIRTTARSHRRVIIVEVMGREAGWIAAYGGLAGGADLVLIPELEIDIDEVCEKLKANRQKGKNYNIIVVSEGAMFKKGDYITKDAEMDEFGNVRLGGIADQLADALKRRTSYEIRTVILGHLQRGGTPTAFDRILGIRYGLKAADLIINREFGKMVALHGNEIIAVPLSEAVSETKTVDMEFIGMLKELY